MGGLFPIKKGVTCVQKMMRKYYRGGNRGTVLRICNDWHLRSWSRSRLGAHTNMDRARKGYVDVKVGIILAVIEGAFASKGKPTKLALRPKEPKPRAALPCGALARGDRAPICLPLGALSLHTSELTFRVAYQFQPKR